jgi:hypothetical protein
VVNVFYTRGGDVYPPLLKRAAGSPHFFRKVKIGSTNQKRTKKVAKKIIQGICGNI